MSPRSHTRLLLLTVATLLSLTAVPAFAQKTDTVLFKHGDLLTCEIKYLKQAKLTVKTIGMGTVSIEWADIAEVISDKYLRVEIQGGQQFYGSFAKPESEGYLRLALGSWTQDFDIMQVVGIQRIKRSFWARLDGSFNFGLSFTKASEVMQTNLGFTSNYRSERNTFDLSYSAIATLQKNAETTTRQDAGLTWEYVIKQRWFSSVNGGYQQNEELGVNNRFLGKIGTGLHAVRSNFTILSGLVGLAVNQEWPTNNFPTQTSLEGWLELSWDYFVYDTPKTSIDTTLDIFPSLTISERIRLQFDIVFSREIISDLYLDLSVYLSYDNKPPDPTASTNDWGLVTGVRFTY